MDSRQLQLDYFKFYDVANQHADDLVLIQGQFDERPEKAQLTYLDFFANPASKNGEPIYDKHAHLSWYDLHDPSPDPMRVVKVENQFGRNVVLTGRTYALLSPAQKYEAGSEFSDELRQFKVYEALDAESRVNQEVELEDQFGTETVRVGHLVFFAVPVRRNWEAEPPEGAHLAIYRIAPGLLGKTIMIGDQFGRRYLKVLRSVMLAVPSVKLSWKEQA